MKATQQFNDWFASRRWTPFPFQEEGWQAYLQGHSGLVNAPTGSGKTYSLLLPALLQASRSNKKGLHIVWIAPIRALTKEIEIACNRAIEGLNLDLTVGIRTGDTTQKLKKEQKSKPPHLLITTPESLHVLMTMKGYSQYFSRLQSVIVDEWHVLIGSKRGVQTELFLSRMRGLNPQLMIWGISATIGNMDEATDVLLGAVKPPKWTFIKADINKEIEVITLLPETLERFPWAGHLGLTLLQEVLPIIYSHRTTLIFTNTRAQSEIWYQQLLDTDPDLAGQIAVHHGSLSREVRDWVEQALYDGQIKAVVCTSSLDLGVDFRPVEAIVQIGSPKGVSRFLQRAGRSGHSPGQKSKIYFVPTHSLEILEAAGLKHAVKVSHLEARVPYIRSWDVLMQYLVTLAVSDGMDPDCIYLELLKTYSYSSMSTDEWAQLLEFIQYGSKSLQAYDEYRKVEIDEEGIYRVTNKRIALRHRLSIGTIVSDAMIKIKLRRGGYIGSIEEYFVSQLSIGDVFWFSGRALELVRVKDMTATVKKATKKTGKIPSYMGSRMSLSSEMSSELRDKIHAYANGVPIPSHDREMLKLQPLLEMQSERSHVPNDTEFLIEYFQSKEGYHLMLYPFEGRGVHEGLGALLANRLSRIKPMTISIQMNDYGVELLSDTDFEIDKVLTPDLFSTDHLISDIQASVNAIEMSRRKFRDIGRISGLIFGGFPGKMKKERHLQSSAQLLFEVFREYDPDNILYRQAYEEVLAFQLEEGRLRNVLTKLQNLDIVLKRPLRASPFAFPIMVDRLSREKLTTETIEDRIEKMKVELYK